MPLQHNSSFQIYGFFLRKLASNEDLQSRLISERAGDIAKLACDPARGDRQQRHVVVRVRGLEKVVESPLHGGRSIVRLLGRYDEPGRRLFGEQHDAPGRGQPVE